MSATTADLLRAHAGQFAEVAMGTVTQEFPNALRNVMTAPGDFPHRPRDQHPAFYGSFDWHSCVEMHWALVRLLRVSGDDVPQRKVRDLLDEDLSGPALATEAEFCAAHRGHSRPYGQSWVLRLAHETATWDDEDARRWAANLAPLASAVADNLRNWLDKATYPNRQGAHFNSAFALSRALPYARASDEALLAAITAAVRRWFVNDTDYPGRFEPNDADFLSPTLTEAELLGQLLPPAEFPSWLSAFLPGVEHGEPATLFTPATVSDSTDGQIAHLHGLNLSRAWCWRRLAELLPADDPRVGPMLTAAATHADRALGEVSGSHYMVEHWLAAYAVLYLTPDP